MKIARTCTGALLSPQSCSEEVVLTLEGAMHESFDSESWNTPLTRRRMLGASLGVAVAGAGVILGEGSRASVASAAEASAGSLEISIANTSATDQIALQAMLASGRYYEKYGVKVNTTNTQSGNTIVAGMQAGSIDATTMSGIIGILPAIAQGVPLKVVGGTQLLSVEAIYTGDSAIKSLKDLGGKTIGVGAVGSELYDLMTATLRKEGISQSSVTFVNLGSSAAVLDGVIAKKVDAGIGQVGDVPIAKAHGCRSLGVIATLFPQYITSAAVATEAAITSKREALVRLLAAHADLYGYLSKPASKPSFVRAYVASGGTDAAAADEWEFIKARGAFSPTLSLPASRMNFTQSLNVAAGTQSKVMPYSSYTDLSLAQAALKLVKQKK